MDLPQINDFSWLFISSFYLLSFLFLFFSIFMSSNLLMYYRFSLINIKSSFYLYW